MLDTELLSKYKLQARIYPSLLAALPVFILVVPVVDYRATLSWAPVVAFSGVMFFVANVVRSRGLKVEERLVRDWNGLPTIHLLRYRESDTASVFLRRRRKLEAIYGESLPSEAEEYADPTTADSIYVAATRALIARLEGKSEQFPRVFDENIHYGFRRNMLGVKPYGITIVGLSLVVDIAIVLYSSITVQYALVTGVHIVVLVAWLLVVRPPWVKEVADRYALRLFEAADNVGDST